MINIDIAICDDGKRFRDFLESHLRNYYDIKNIPLNFFHFSSGKEFLENDLLFDLVFPDAETGNIAEHNYETVITAPTCTANGSKYVINCSVFDEEISRETVTL